MNHRHRAHKVSSMTKQLYCRRQLACHNWSIPIGIQFADPNFNVPGCIDLLIGAELFFDLVTGGQLKIAPQLPLLQETKLGWIVSGPFSSHVTSTLQHVSAAIVHHQIATHRENEENLDATLRKFWEIEECDFSSRKNKEEELCEAEQKGKLIVVTILAGTRSCYRSANRSLSLASQRQSL